jgi:hypothetical protein
LRITIALLSAGLCCLCCLCIAGPLDTHSLGSGAQTAAGTPGSATSCTGTKQTGKKNPLQCAAPGAIYSLRINTALL